MKTVVIGAGYVGMALLGQWKEGDQVLVATTTRNERHAELNQLADQIVTLRGNDKDALSGVLADADRVVVCAAPQRGGSYEVVYLETAKALRDVLRQNQSVKQLVYTSATSVYGDCNGDWVDEEAVVAPSSEGGKILCQAESIYLHDLPEQIDVTVVRLAGIYGPGRELQKRAERFSGKEFPGSGDAFTNNVHRDDIVRSIDWVLENHLTGIYNVCEEEHPTRAESYARVLEPRGLPMPKWNEENSGPHSGNKRVSSEKLCATGFVYRHQKG